MPNSVLSPSRSAFLAIALVFLVVVAQYIFPLLGFVLHGYTSINEIGELYSQTLMEPNPTIQNVLLIVQGLSSSVGFIFIPIGFLIYVEKEKLYSTFNSQNIKLEAFLLLFGLTISCMMVNSIFIEWNMNIQLPEPMHSSLKAEEEAREHLTNYLINFYSPAYFIFSFIVIAIIPAVGEELVFRGFLQRFFSTMFGNVHVAIWLSAILFSAIHMQFFGFVPRMMLGAFFGYILFYSGNLWYAIAAHFVNNGFTLIMLYLYQQGAIQYDIENTESIPLQTVLIFLIIGVILFTLFVRKFQNSESPSHG